MTYTVSSRTLNLTQPTIGTQVAEVLVYVLLLLMSKYPRPKVITDFWLDLDESSKMVRGISGGRVPNSPMAIRHCTCVCHHFIDLLVCQSFIYFNL